MRSARRYLARSGTIWTGGQAPIVAEAGLFPEVRVRASTGRWIVTANYSAGSVGVVPIEKDGTLGPRSDLVNLPGEPGPDRKQQRRCGNPASFLSGKKRKSECTKDPDPGPPWH
jgi:hypothetical protein